MNEMTLEIRSLRDFLEATFVFDDEPNHLCYSIRCIMSTFIFVFYFVEYEYICLGISGNDYRIIVIS